MMKRTLFTVLGASAVLACSSAASSPDGADAGGVDNPADADGGSSGTSGTSGTSGSSGSSGSSGTPVAKSLTLAGLTFRNVGRQGDALRIGIKGGDTLKETSAAVIKTVDENDAPVVTFDTNWDGVPDSAERRFHFDSSTLGMATFLASITIPGVYGETSKIAKVVVKLEDESGGQSATLTQPIAKQAIRGEIEACDPSNMTDRCTPGMGCTGTPSTCHPGVAPDLSQLAYYGGASPRMLFAGTEPDQDVKQISVEFLDANGSPTSVNLGTKDDPVMNSGIVLDATSSMAGGGSFFFSNTPSAGFDTLVPKIAATVSDAAGNTSSRVVVAATAVPTRAAGQACDWAGFDACAAGNACAPGIAGAANVCTAKTTLATAKCGGAPQIDPAKGATKAFGATAGASLWDAPIGCVPNDAVGRPESAVRLHLGAAVANLVITTAVPETDHDTAVYLVPGCPTSSAGALGCNDDTTGFSSTLSLKNVAAGDYTIVVESVNMRGGRFGVSVQAK